MADLTSSVMERVAKLERRRVGLWLGVFLLILAALGFAFLVAAWQTGTLVFERGSLDLLTLFSQDPEIIGEFWQDTLTTFWEELPHRSLFILVAAGVLLPLLFVATRKGRETLRMKLFWLWPRIKGK